MKTTKKQTGNREKMTEQVAQASLQLLPLIMNNIPQAVFWKDRNLVYLGCNQAFAEDAGFPSPEEIVGKTDFDMPWKDQAELYRADDRLVMDNEKPKLNYEEPQTTPDDSTIWLNTSKIPVYENGQVVAVLGMYEDITERKQTEALMRSMVENAPEAIGIIDLNTGLFTEPNEKAVKLYGLSREELVKVGPADMSPPVQPDGSPSTEKAMEKINQAMQGESPVFEWMHRNARGEDILCEVRLVRLPGNLPRVRFSVTDITARKRAEEEIVAESQRFQTILESVRVPMIISRLSDGIVIYANQAVARVSQVDLDKLIGFKTGNFYANPDDRKTVLESLQQYGRISDFEVQFRRTDGSLYWALLSSHIINYEGEKCVLSSYVDITERKQAENALKESEEKFRAIADNTAIGLFIHQGGIMRYLGREAACMLDYDPADVVGHSIMDFIYPDERQRIAEIAQRRTAGEDVPDHYETRLLKKDGSALDVILYSTLVNYEGEVATQGAFLDITERKQVVEALRDSQQVLQTVMDNIPQSIFWKDRNLTYLGCNRAFADDAGLDSPSDVIGKTDWDMPWKEQAELYRADDGLVMESDTPKLNYEEPQTTPDGSIIWLRTSKVPMHNVDGKVTAVLGMYEDITERKQAEEALRDSQQVLQTVMDNIPQSIFWKDRNLNYLGCNRAFADDAGFASPSDVIGKTDWDMPWKEQAELYRADDNRVMESDTPKLNYEEPQTTPDGSTSWLRTSKVPLHDVDGKVTAVLGMYEDITERKNLEQQVQTAFERRGLQVQLSTQVSQSIAAASNLAELYQRVVTQVKEQFGYYHTQILRYDAAQEAVVLVTGYGEVGEKMLAAGHRMPMGEGLIGTAAATGETVLRSVLENDLDWHPNPLLPETKGEIAVPIKLGDTILGVLDVQSNEAEALDADTQLLLEGLCGQVATAIESIRLRQEMAERLEEINRLYRAMSHEGWQVYRQTEDIPAGFIYDQIGVVPVQANEIAERLFINQSIAVPGGETIGTLSIADDSQHPLSSEDISMVQQISEQIALALESARLFDQTQSALAQSEKLFDASRSLTQAKDLQELVAAAVKTLDISIINRAVLTTFDYDSAGNIEQLTVIANCLCCGGRLKLVIQVAG